MVVLVSNTIVFNQFQQTDTIHAVPCTLSKRRAVVLPRATAVLPESFAQQLNSTLKAGDHDIIEYIGTSRTDLSFDSCSLGTNRGLSFALVYPI